MEALWSSYSWLWRAFSMLFRLNVIELWLVFKQYTLATNKATFLLIALMPFYHTPVFFCVGITSVWAHGTFQDFKVQHWPQGWKLSIPLTCLNRPEGWQIKSLSPIFPWCVALQPHVNHVVLTTLQRMFNNFTCSVRWQITGPSRCGAGRDIC